MSRVAELIDAALKEALPVSGRIALAGVQRRVSRRVIEAAAMQYRRAAELLDEAVALLPEPTKGTQPSE